MKSNYSHHMIAGAAVVVDMGAGVSVTNNAEGVIAELIERGVDVNTMPVIYRDTMGRWDQLVCARGKFKAFAPLKQPFELPAMPMFPAAGMHHIEACLVLCANPELMRAPPRTVVVISPDENSDYVYLDVTKEAALAKFKAHDDWAIYQRRGIEPKVTVGDATGGSFMLWRNIGNDLAKEAEARGVPSFVADLLRGGLKE